MHDFGAHKSTILEFTDDMAETLHTYFQSYEQNGVVRIIANDMGLWLINPARPRNPQFLGKACITTEKQEIKKSCVH